MYECRGNMFLKLQRTAYGILCNEANLEWTRSQVLPIRNLGRRRAALSTPPNFARSNATRIVRRRPRQCRCVQDRAVEPWRIKARDWINGISPAYWDITRRCRQPSAHSHGKNLHFPGGFSKRGVDIARQNDIVLCHCQRLPKAIFRLGSLQSGFEPLHSLSL